jgi:uncharacterized membrane protein YidH (DUF202 family)
MVLPAVARAASSFKDIVSNTLLPLFNSIVGFIMVLAVLAFMAGAIRFMATSGDDRSRVTGKQMMLWGIIALFLMISVWGVVKIVKTSIFGTL